MCLLGIEHKEFKKALNKRWFVGSFPIHYSGRRFYWADERSFQEECDGFKVGSKASGS